MQEEFQDNNSHRPSTISQYEAFSLVIDRDRINVLSDEVDVPLAFQKRDKIPRTPIRQDSGFGDDIQESLPEHFVDHNRSLSSLSKEEPSNTIASKQWVPSCETLHTSPSVRQPEDKESMSIDSGKTGSGFCHRAWGKYCVIS